jgi:methionyl-tRNA formyltransferase
VRLVFAGTPAVALPALAALHGSGHELVAVVTRPDAPAGRGRNLVRSPVGAWADEHGIEVLTPQRPREPEFLDRLRELAPDCVPVVAYGALVPPVALEIPRHGWINLHFSLLPAWRGAAPVQHAVLHGDQLTGASVFQLEAGLDTGPVFGTVTDEVRPTDTAGDLLDRLAASGAGLLTAVLDAIGAGTARAEPQPTDGVSLAPKLTVEDARVRWTDPSFAVDRRIRACTPAPGAWSTFRGDRIKLGPVRPVADGPDLKPGELFVERGRVLVGTATTTVALGEVRAAGKRAMPGPDWARGARVATGDRFGDDPLPGDDGLPGDANRPAGSPQPGEGERSA